MRIVIATVISLFAFSCAPTDGIDDDDDFTGLGDPKADGFTGKIKDVGGSMLFDMGKTLGPFGFAGGCCGTPRYAGIAFRAYAGPHDFLVKNTLGNGGVYAWVIDQAGVIHDVDRNATTSARVHVDIPTGPGDAKTWWLVFRTPTDGSAQFRVSHGGTKNGFAYPLPPECTLKVSPAQPKVGTDLTFTLASTGMTKQCLVTDVIGGAAHATPCTATWKVHATIAGTLDAKAQVIGPGDSDLVNVFADSCTATVVIAP